MRIFLIQATLLVAVGFSGDVAVLAQSSVPKPVPTAIANDLKADDFLGTLDGSNYANKFFGISLTVPESYILMNRAEISVYANASSDLMKGASKTNDRKVDEAMQNQTPLLMIAQLPPGSAGNAIFEMSVRKQATGVTANMVLAESLKIMTGSTKAVLKRSIPRSNFGGKTFAGFEVETELAGVKLAQEFYVTIHRGYAVVMALTYAPAADRKAFDTMLAGLSIKVR